MDIRIVLWVFMCHLVQQYDIDHGEGAAESFTTNEKEELRRLRRENRVLKMEREVLKKATAFFAKEND